MTRDNITVTGIITVEYAPIPLAQRHIAARRKHPTCALFDPTRSSSLASESTHLQEDPSLLAALVLCNSGAILWRDAALRIDL